MRARDLVAGNLYLLEIVGTISNRSYYPDLRYDDSSHFVGSKTVLRCVRPGRRYLSPRFEFVSSTSEYITKKFTGTTFLIYNCRYLTPYEDPMTATLTVRQKKVASMRKTIESNRKEIQELQNKIRSLTDKTDDMEKRVISLEAFESDEAELAHMLHTLLTQGGSMTPQDIEAILKHRTTTSQL